MKEFLNVAKSLEIKEISKNVNFAYYGETSSNLNYSNVDIPDSTDKTFTKGNVSDQSSSVIGQVKVIDQKQQNIDRISHAPSRNYECDKCESSFQRLSNLNRHLKSKHEGVKFPCNQCDYQATYQVNLKHHIQAMHEGIKLSCNQCNSQFTFESALNKHVRFVHSG